MHATYGRLWYIYFKNSRACSIPFFCDRLCQCKIIKRFVQEHLKNGCANLKVTNYKVSAICNGKEFDCIFDINNNITYITTYISSRRRHSKTMMVPTINKRDILFIIEKMVDNDER